MLALILRPRPEHLPGHAYPVPAPGRRIRVEVLNGTRRQGLARAATRALRGHGLDVVYFATGPAADSTRIYVRRGEPGQGRDVAEALGVLVSQVLVGEVQPERRIERPDLLEQGPAIHHRDLRQD